MEEKTKKYLEYGALAVGGLYLWHVLSKKYDKAKDKKPKAKSTAASPLAPPTPANMPYSPISLPGAGYAPYAPPYAPSYYPQQYQYPTPYLPGTPYVPPVSGYPGYPGGYPTYPPPYAPGVGTPQQVVGLTVPAARQILIAEGYRPVIATINGRPIPQAAYVQVGGGPIAYIDEVNGLVSYVRYSGTPYSVSPSPYGGVAY